MTVSNEKGHTYSFSSKYAQTVGIPCSLFHYGRPYRSVSRKEPLTKYIIALQTKQVKVQLFTNFRIRQKKTYGKRKKIIRAAGQTGIRRGHRYRAQW